MLTLLLILIPFAAALLTPLIGSAGVKRFALIASLIQLAVTVYAFTMFSNDVQDQFLVNYWWVKDLGISFKAGMDGVSILMVALTNVLLPLIILSSFRNDYKNPVALYGLILFMQSALVGVFTALDGFLFYVFWELALIPIYFICLLWGGADRVRITLKFFIYTLSGSLLMLVSMIWLYMQTPGAHSFDLSAFYNLSLTASQQSWLFWGFFLAFAVKIPVFPLHTWQPDTYTDAPAQGTMLLSGIMLKMGIYGMIRWMLPVLPLGMQQWQPLVMTLAICGVVYGACMALVQKDLKRLIAYSSVSHVGLIAAGTMTLTIEGLQGSMVQMLSHGINVVGMFFIVDIIQRRMKTRNLNELGGIANNNPVFSILFMIILLGTVALPLTNGFVGEFLLLNSVFQVSHVMAAVAGLTIILGAVYMLRAYQASMLGETTNNTVAFTGLMPAERTVLIIIAVLVIAAGIYPKPVFHVAQPALEEILIHAKALN